MFNVNLVVIHRKLRCHINFVIIGDTNDDKVDIVTSLGFLMATCSANSDYEVGFMIILDLQCPLWFIHLHW